MCLLSRGEGGITGGTGKMKKGFASLEKAEIEQGFPAAKRDSSSSLPAIAMESNLES